MAIKNLEIVAVSTVDQQFADEYARKRHTGRHYYIGAASDGRHVVEDVDCGSIGLYDYVAVVPKPRYYVKSVTETMKELIARNYMFDDGRFVSNIDVFEFHVDDWSLCGEALRDKEDAEEQGWPEWMIEVVEYDNDNIKEK